MADERIISCESCRRQLDCSHKLRGEICPELEFYNKGYEQGRSEINKAVVGEKLLKMIDDFTEATELAEACSHTQDTAYTKLCREVTDFLNWYKNQDFLRREDVVADTKIVADIARENGRDAVAAAYELAIAHYEKMPAAGPFK